MDYPGKVITKNQVTPTQTSATGVWTLDDVAAAVKNNNWPVAGVPNPISKSLRFNSADSAYLNRTFSTPTSQNIWSFSCWLKRSSLADQQFIFWAGTSATNDCALYFTSSDQIGWFTNNGVSVNSTSTAVFRDPSAWYHIVAIANSTTMNVYVNNQQIITNAGMTNNTINSAIAHCIGQDVQTSGNEFSGYMTEINFIDGQALTPSSFGMTNPQTGQWIPLKYSGTYGTNGFYLNFKDATSTTTLGYDYSGNANNWTTNNFSVTAGAGNDSLTDVPTPWIAYNTTGDVGGVVRGNYCTWNPLMKASQVTLTNGNLDAAHGTFGTNTGVFGGIAVSSGKWYWEETITALSSGAPYIGIMKPEAITQTFTTLYANTTSGYAYRSTGDKRTNSSDSAYGASYTTNDVIGVALDMDAGTLVFYKNGVSQGTAFSSLSGTFVAADANGTSGGTYSSTINFGQRPFAYTPPSGFLSLCTTNLPASTVLKGSDYFNAILYTGNGSASRSITGVGFQPDFVWAKARSAAYYHGLFDNLRSGYALYSNATDAEDTTEQLTFGSDGFTTPNKSGDFINTNSATYVAWNWKANGAGVTNTAGTITSTVSANTTSGFSIVSWTSNGSTSIVTTGHGLGVAPDMIITKNRDLAGTNWVVYHKNLSVPNDRYLLLNGTNAEINPSRANWSTSSTTFGIYQALICNNGDKAIAYCFAPISGFSAFGSYTGNGSADGPFVYLGFRPRYIMRKRTDSTGSWIAQDSARPGYNATTPYTSVLYPNASDAELSYNEIDILSNGFKIRATDTFGNASGGTYIYAAFAENPFKNALAR